MPAPPGSSGLRAVWNPPCSNTHAACLRLCVFVIDSGADGLKADAEDGQRFDIVWRDGREQTMFNSSWKDQKLTKDEYLERFAEQEAAYTGMLAVLSASLRGTTRR